MYQYQTTALNTFKDYRDRNLTPVDILKQFSVIKLDSVINGIVKIKGAQFKPQAVDFKVNPIWNRIQELWLALLVTNIRALIAQGETSSKVETVPNLLPSRTRTKISKTKTSHKNTHTIPFYMFYDAWFGTPQIYGASEYSVI
jgi:hypothetical protein